MPNFSLFGRTVAAEELETNVDKPTNRAPTELLATKFFWVQSLVWGWNTHTHPHTHTFRHSWCLPLFVSMANEHVAYDVFWGWVNTRSGQFCLFKLFTDVREINTYGLAVKMTPGKKITLLSSHLHRNNLKFSASEWTTQVSRKHNHKRLKGSVKLQSFWLFFLNITQSLDLI